MGRIRKIIGGMVRKGAITIKGRLEKTSVKTLIKRYIKRTEGKKNFSAFLNETQKKFFAAFSEITVFISVDEK